jgi:glutamate decarboxylase
VKLLNTILPKLLDFIASADDVNASRISISAEEAPSLQLAALRDPAYVSACLKMAFKEQGGGVDGVEDLVQRVLDVSVNTWDHGFMHKLYGGTNAPGVASELILAVLNTNVRPQCHV